MSNLSSKAKAQHALSMHSSQGKIFRKTQEELIDDDWMKFKGLNMRKEDSFQQDQENGEAKRFAEDQSRNRDANKQQLLKPIQDNSQNPLNIVSFSKYYEEITSIKNILSHEDIITPIQESNNYRYEDKQSSYQMQLQQINGSHQQLQQPSMSAGLSRKRVATRIANNKPSINMIGSTSAVENGKDHNHSNSGNMRLLNQKNFSRIMQIRKQIQNFINYYTTFGRKNFLQNVEVRKFINDKSDGGSDIGDVSGCLGLYRLIGCIRRFKCYRMIKGLKFEIINPHTTLYLIWQMYITFYNYLFFIALSLIIVFSAGVNNESVENYYFGFTSFQWSLEILLKINTAKYIKTRLINSRAEILRVYLKNSFIYDIVPLVLVLLRSQYKSHIIYIAFRIPLFLKLINSIREAKEAERQLLMNLKHFYIVQLMNLVVNLFLVGHLISCLWYLMSLIQSDLMNSDESWFKEGIGSDGVWWKIYLQAFYWSFTLMATGSNEATTTLEVFFTSVIMLFTTIVFGYMVNTIGVILSEMNKLEEDQRKDINLINKYMKRKQISKKLQHRINLDLEQFYLRSTRNKSEEENSVLSKISSDLNEEIKLEYNKNILSKIKFFADNFTEETIDKLCLSIEEAFYSPNQIIYQEKESTEPSLMVIVAGQVDIFKGGFNSVQINNNSNNNNEDNNETHNHYLPIKKNSNSDPKSMLKSLKKGSTLGEVNFFTGCQRENTAKSRTFTTILKIERSTFLSIIDNCQKDFETFCEMRDKIQLYKNYRIIQKQCKICQSSQHVETHCQQVHFNKDSPFLLGRINLQVTQIRNEEFERRRVKKINNSYTIRMTVIACIETLRQQYDLVEENRRNRMNNEIISQNNLLSIDYEIDDEEYHKQIDEDDDEENEFNDDGRYSPGISPNFNKDESIMMQSIHGVGFAPMSQVSNGGQQLYIIPEEPINQRTLDRQLSEAPIFQNTNSMLFLGYGSSNNMDQGIQPQRKQTIKFPSNGYVTSSLSQQNNINSTAIPITSREEQYIKEQLERDDNDELTKSTGGREYLYQSFRENDNQRKSIILNGSPRVNQRTRTMLTKKFTQQYNENGIIIQSRRFAPNTLSSQTNQLNGVGTSAEKQKQAERSGERLNSFLKTENWNDKLIPLEEKNKNDFLFEFDSLKLFQYYFQEGNANIRIAKWNTLRKKYLKKYASGDAAQGKRSNRTVPSMKFRSQNIILPLSPQGVNPQNNKIQK